MTIVCPHCNAKLTDDAITLGRRVQCPYCSEKFVVDASHVKRTITRLNVMFLTLLCAIILGLGIVFCLVRSGSSSCGGQSLQDEMPTNSFSYVKDKLAVLTLPNVQGSGFVLTMGTKKYLLTNEHVVRAGNGAKPKAMLLSGETLELGACEVAKDRDLIRFEVPSNTASLVMSCEIPEIGDHIVVYGNSDGGGVSTEIDGQVLGVGGDRLEIDAKFVTGNSGSPVVNTQGYVDGVATYLTKSIAAEDNWIKKDTRFTDIRRFATRVVHVPWMAVEWDEYKRQIQLCNDLEYFLLRLSQYLKVRADDAFTPSVKVEYSEAERSRYGATAEIFHPALIRVQDSYAALKQTHKAKEKNVDVDALVRTHSEAIASGCAFNHEKQFALQVAKSVLQKAKITLPVFGAENTMEIGKYCSAIDDELAAISAANPQSQIVIENAFRMAASKAPLELEVAFSAISALVSRNIGDANERFVAFCEAEDRNDGLAIAPFISDALKKCLDDAYATGRHKTGYLLGCIVHAGSRYDDAAKYWEGAAESEVSHAQYLLGVCYAKGRGVIMDEEKAAKWYAKASEHGFVFAQHNLGVCYANGIGMEGDWNKAASLFQKAAEQGDADAQYNLGVCYEFGIGIEKDMHEANKWFITSKEHGCQFAQRHMGGDEADALMNDLDGGVPGLGMFKDEYGKVEEYRDIAQIRKNRPEVVTPSPNMEDNKQREKMLANIAAAERQRRELNELKAYCEINKARSAMQNRRYDECAEHYSKALKLLRDIPNTKELRTECLQGVAECLYRAALEEYGRGRREKAIELMEKAVDMRHPKARHCLNEWKNAK